jgi:hypothetical protein
LLWELGLLLYRFELWRQPVEFEAPLAAPLLRQDQSLELESMELSAGALPEA